MTHGVDVAAKKLPGGGSLVLADCPGPRFSAPTRGMGQDGDGVWPALWALCREGPVFITVASVI